MKMYFRQTYAGSALETWLMLLHSSNIYPQTFAALSHRLASILNSDLHSLGFYYSSIMVSCIAISKQQF